MFFIFGTRVKRRRLGTVLMMCQSCHRPCSHVVGMRQTWFTLFFIPLIPFKATHFTVCSMCSASFKQSKEDAARLVAVGAQQSSQPAEMTPDGPLSATAPPLVPGAPAPPVPQREADAE